MWNSENVNDRYELCRNANIYDAGEEYLKGHGTPTVSTLSSSNKIK